MLDPIMSLPGGACLAPVRPPDSGHLPPVRSGRVGRRWRSDAGARALALAASAASGIGAGIAP